MKVTSEVPQSFIPNLIEAMPSLKDEQVLAVIGGISRAPFVPSELRDRAYDMAPLPHGHETWPHPALLAYMLQALKPKAEQSALVIGSCGGYLAALLVAMGTIPTVIEINEETADATSQNLNKIGYPEIDVGVFNDERISKVGRGFASIISTYAVAGVPYGLISQLRLNGRLVTGSAPLGLPLCRAKQNLILIEKMSDGEVRDGVQIYPRIRMADLLNVEFVPLTSEGITKPTLNETEASPSLLQQGASLRGPTAPKSEGHTRERKPNNKRSGYTTEEALRLSSAGPASGVFTDGSANPNPGPGGWGYVYVQDDEILSQECGYDPDTTNNKMELTALIHAYKSLPQDAKVDIYSDSNLCVRTINEWARSWERNGWKRKTGPIANLDLVQELYAEAKRRPGVKLKWIEAHIGWKWNEYADALSTSWQR